ncbi:MULTISPECIES: hypothetical protein [Lacticaseibacillus]|uniref:hypothetical protein n=1 Tax=Lacticaseibacillus TaxID=2759736 RepID=UPI000ADFD95D|nr:MULTISPECIES: hypothetical protein [Lacticaseibacillus]
MEKQSEVVHFQLDQSQTKKVPAPTKALQIRVNQNKTVIVYNHVQGYILDALLKAVF